jgi:hypothetical protein
MSARRKRPSRDLRNVAEKASIEDGVTVVMARLEPWGAIPVPPPGIHIDRFSLEDRRQSGSIEDDSDKTTHLLEVWTSQRDRVIDSWLDAERYLRTAATLLLSPNETLREQVWTLVCRQSGDPLIRLAGDLLGAKGHRLPPDFVAALSKLCRLRNLFAHQVSRPLPESPITGLMFLQSKEFKKGSYVTVSFAEIEETLARNKPVLGWLLAEIPDADGVSVQFEDDLFDQLD